MCILQVQKALPESYLWQLVTALQEGLFAKTDIVVHFEVIFDVKATGKVAIAGADAMIHSVESFKTWFNCRCI